MENAADVGLKCILFMCCGIRSLCIKKHSVIIPFVPGCRNKLLVMGHNKAVLKQSNVIAHILILNIQTNWGCLFQYITLLSHRQYFKIE
jgi:hypothetical protein